MCWSPDGKYILTGGQDDLVSIWSLNERQIVARCQGHHSWVTAVAFDPWRCDEKNYRFGSVGDDCKLLLWDFSVGMLHRPKAVSNSAAPFHLMEAVSRLTNGTDANGKATRQHIGSINIAPETENGQRRHPPTATIRLKPSILWGPGK